MKPTAFFTSAALFLILAAASELSAQQRDVPQQPRPPQTEWRLEPQSWIRIAADYDGDGRYEVVEYIYGFDLERAQQSSHNRRQQAQRSGQNDQYALSYRAQDRRERMDDRGQSRSHKLHFRVEGELQDLDAIQLSGVKGKEVIGRLKTDEGRTAKVAFGPQDQLDNLELEEGDRVTVQGKVGRINDRTMLMAYRVQSDGRTVRVERPRGEGLQRFQGEVLGTRSAQLRDVDREQLVARIRLDEGRTLEAILGPRSQLEKLDLQVGDQVAMLAHRARLNQQRALVAEQVSADGRVVKVDLPEREQFQRQQRQDQRQDRRDRWLRDR